jgi:hypothetical protein
VVKRREVFERAVVTCDRADLAALLRSLVANDELEARALKNSALVSPRNARR